VAIFTGTIANETITPTFVSPTVVSNPAGSFPGSATGDYLRGFGGNDILTGGSGDDQLDGGTGADIMTGGGGADTYSVDNPGDQVIETPSVYADTVDSTISYTLPVNVENLFLIGSSAINGTGNDVKNTITGNQSNNVIKGLGGDDVLSGSAGDDKLYGDAGNDHLDGGIGKDFLDGGIGNDILNGSNGNDIMIGGDGNDRMDGGNDDDTLTGGVGADVLRGGLGLDHFDFNFVGESAPGLGTSDTIADFVGNGSAVGDVIDLRNIDADPTTPGNQAFRYIGGAQFSANATAELRYAGGVLQGSTNSNATPEFEVRLTGAPALSVGGAGSDILL
jgi:Ca2+-binding RTX toxin-like protein